MFQSPRSGKFESNPLFKFFSGGDKLKCFNPLDRGNLNQIAICAFNKEKSYPASFNPLDRGNLNQIILGGRNNAHNYEIKFQSPRSGKFESNTANLLTIKEKAEEVSIP